MTATIRHWHIVANVPGYLPEAEPVCFDGTEAEAAQYVWQEAIDTLGGFNGGSISATAGHPARRPPCPPRPSAAP